MSKKVKGLIVTLIIINVTLLGAVGYFVYDKYFTSNEVVDGKTTDNEETDGVISDELLAELQKKIDSMGPEIHYASEIYMGKNIYNSEMDNQLKTASVLNYIGGAYNCKSFYNGWCVVDDATVSNIYATYKLLFGPDQEYVPDTKDNIDRHQLHSLYKDGDKYLYVGGGGGSELSVFEITEKVTKTNDEIKIYKRVGFSHPQYNEKGDYEYYLYSDYYLNNLISKDAPSYEEFIKANPDKFNLYEITFKLDSTGNYYFYSSEIVK